MPFLAAHVPIGALICGSVIDVRAMYGDLVVMTDVAALKITIGFFACVAMSATASASGVKPETGQEVDLVAHHQLLRQSLGHFGRRTAGVLNDDLDLAPGDRGRR